MLFSNIFQTCLILAAVCCTVLADRSPYRPPSAYRAPQPAPSRYQPSDDSFEDPKYDFQWQVDEDANLFQQQETRDGEDTRGEYTVDLPDGRTQKVTYYVDGDSGFIAEVSYEGEARYPEEQRYSAPRPTYQAPTTRRPSYSPPRTTPRPTYSRPTTRRPSYSPPRRTYDSQSLLSAFGF